MSIRGVPRIVLSRVDQIGDVVLTLPMAGLIKKYLPASTVFFLGQSYTKPVVESCVFVDQFVEWKKDATQSQQIDLLESLQADVIIHVFPCWQVALAACRAQIPCRIGTSRRFFHWLTCNKLVSLARHGSSSHEAQLNLKLLAGIGFSADKIARQDIHALYGLHRILPLSQSLQDLLPPGKFHLILHPKSRGSAREWSASRFVELIHLLDEKKFSVFISGINEEHDFIEENIIKKTNGKAKNLAGRFSLADFISFLDACHGFVSASTGPLHIAAALGKHSLGLYPPRKAMDPKRWGPLGAFAQSLVAEGKTENCRNPCALTCPCMESISPLLVKHIIEEWHSHFLMEI